MGNKFCKNCDLQSWWNERHPLRVLLLGLDGAGKTTILYRVKLKETIETNPTIGFNVESVSPKKGVTFTVWDVGGQYKLRPLWKYYFMESRGLFYIIDSCDRIRINEAAEEFHKVIHDENMCNVPVVIIANKQDLPNAISCEELVIKMGLNKINNKWHIQGACAVTGEGIFEAMQKMAQMVRQQMD